MIFPELDPRKSAYLFAERRVWNAATVRLADCNLRLVLRLGDRIYGGYIAISRGSHIAFPRQNEIVDYDVFNTQWNPASAAVLNRRRFEYWLASQDSSQPFLIATVLTVDEKVDTLKTLYHRDHQVFSRQINPESLLRRYSVRAADLQRELVLSWRTIDPDLQWSNSFNPIVSHARTWYLDYHISPEHISYDRISYQWDIDWSWTLNRLADSNRDKSEKNEAFVMMNLFGKCRISYELVRLSSIRALQLAKQHIMQTVVPMYHSECDEHILDVLK